MLVFAYLAAVVAANLSAAFFGPAALPINAFLLIGFDLTARDLLHARWAQDGLARRMAVLVLTGSALSALLNHSAARVAAASAAAFLVSGGLDTLVFHHTRSIRRSNLAGAAVDSLLFAPLAFGVLDPTVFLLQFAAKTAGGELWARGLKRWRHG